MNIRFSIVFIIFIFLSGCSQSVQTDRVYQEIGMSEHFQLVKDGYIIGLEKKAIKTKGKLLNGLTSENPYKLRFKPLADTTESSKKLNHQFLSKTEGQQKVMLATQITSNFPQINYRYNAYKRSLKGEFDYERSFKELDLMFDDLSQRLNSSNKYSHIIVMSMGWNNDQVESLFRYNQIIKHLSNLALKDDPKFNPLVIGFTWPSVWSSVSDSWVIKSLGHLLSYPNKTNDADEIGYTWANWVINKKIPEAIQLATDNGLKKENAPKLVVIGHSLGARLLSRALFSSDHIKPSRVENSVDLFIGLQGAFSARRFLSEQGLEGSPYKKFQDIGTKIILTSSINDKANPVANWITGAHHVGGENGLETAIENDKVFDVQVWEETGNNIQLPTDKVLMLDVSKIVKDTNEVKESGPYEYSAHNDILDPEMAELLWSFIRQIP